MAGASSKEKAVKPIGWVWFSGIMLAMTVCLPYIIEFLCSKAYPTHRHGVVFVTGATTAVGKAACFALLEDGYIVYGGVKSDSEAHLITDLGKPKLKPITLDLAKPDTFDAAVKKIEKVLNGKEFTALINTIEGGMSSPLETQDVAALKKVFDVNTFGTLEVVQKFLPLIRAQGSRIVFLSSLCAHLTPALFGGMCASKAALESLADGLRRELVPYKISVSSIEPVVALPEGNDDASSKASQDKAGETYAHLYAKKGKGAQSLVSNSSPAVIGKAVIHAVSSTHPKIRYPAGKIGHLPASVVAFLSMGLPGRLQDVLLA